MRFSVLLLWTLQSTATAMDTAAISCTTNQDCNNGETCVAGDSATPVQSCVAGTVCGGLTSGNCPGSAASGPLACMLRDGIYKCLSIERCDEYFGGSLCSAGCNVNGVQCNGQGSCNLLSATSDATPRFGCTCLDGYSGDKCESGSRAGSSATSGSFSKTSSSSSSSSGSLSKDSSRYVSASGSFSKESSSSVSASGSIAKESGSSASAPRSFSRDASSSVSASGSFSKDSSSSISSSASASSSSSSASSLASSISDSMSGESSSSFSSSANGSLKGSSSSATAVLAEDTSDNENAVPQSTDNESSGISSAVFILIGILAACVIVGALMFALFSRKKKRELEAEAGGFGGPAANNATPAALSSSGADTPKSNIVTM